MYKLIKKPVCVCVCGFNDENINALDRTAFLLHSEYTFKMKMNTCVSSRRYEHADRNKTLVQVEKLLCIFATNCTKVYRKNRVKICDVYLQRQAINL